jgi:hypothetical protein
MVDNSINNNKLDAKLNEISDKCKVYSAFYFKKSNRYSTVNTILNIINISFTTITGILSTYTATVSQQETMHINYISSFMLYSSACINSVQQFLNLEALSEKRKTTAMRFLAMSNNIVKYLYTDTTMDRREYMKWVLTEYETMLSQESLVANKLVVDRERTAVVDSARVPDIDIDVAVSEDRSSPPHYKYEVDRFLVTSYNS